MTNVAAETAATFCATLADEWQRSGVREAVICPGSRSTPLALALVRQAGIRVSVRLDERAAGFFGVGLALASGRPVVLLTTSGTAAAELHAAVVEAHHAGVPLIVCTADRPPELHDVGAPQAIDQLHLYGRAVRWFAAPGVPDEAGRTTWRSLASRAVAEAQHGPLGPGPVHLNLAFREPLNGEAGPLPPPRASGGTWPFIAGPMLTPPTFAMSCARPPAASSWRVTAAGPAITSRRWRRRSAGPFWPIRGQVAGSPARTS
jgi:2-succinyl-5-enolpyruvyl-6-hydroxy-3-cyclohexene-1-carboxylate synthase